MPQQLFTYNAGNPIQTFVVPSHAAGTLRFVLRGGRGGSPHTSPAAYLGGYGGYIAGVLLAAASDEITIELGGAGRAAANNQIPPAGDGSGGGGPLPGGNGGLGGAFIEPSPGTIGSGGGGGSRLRIGVSDIAVAGGGGGAGKTVTSGGARAGRGSYQTGAGEDDPTHPPPSSRGNGGTGGTLVGPGAGGASSAYVSTFTGLSHNETSGASGSGGAGGDGANVITDTDAYTTLPPEEWGGGGGGGGGYYGGGGGGGYGAPAPSSRRSGGGGGGSSWSDSAWVMEGAVSFDSANGLYPNGYVIFQWEPARSRRGFGLIR